MFEVLKLHAELVYHPSKAVMLKYLGFFLVAPYAQLKAFFEGVKGNHIMQKPTGFHPSIIEKAFENKDASTVIDAYLDILDYANAGLTEQHLQMVFESLDYDTAIDHGLVAHLWATTGSLSLQSDPTIRLHQALYFYKTKGYLSAVDLLKDISGVIGSSEILKKEFFAHIFTDALDADVKGQLADAIRAIPLERWADRTFYGIEDHLVVLEEPVIEEQPASEQPVAEQQQ